MRLDTRLHASLSRVDDLGAEHVRDAALRLARGEQHCGLARAAHHTHSPAWRLWLQGTYRHIDAHAVQHRSVHDVDEQDALDRLQHLELVIEVRRRRTCLNTQSKKEQASEQATTAAAAATDCCAAARAGRGRAQHALARCELPKAEGAVLVASRLAPCAAITIAEVGGLLRGRTEDSTCAAEGRATAP